ncbi:MAG: hypothetical protein SGARI_003026, partial [Bacillariaceae sp.]
MSKSKASARPWSPPSPSSSYVVPSFRSPFGLKYERVGLPHFNVFRVRLPKYLVHENVDRIVELAEAHGKTLSTGWKTELYSLTKCDMACRDIPGVKTYLRPIFQHICHAIQVLYGSQRLIVDKNQPHILKYSAAAGHTG